MMMRKASFILLLLCAFIAWSCQEKIVPGVEGSGLGSIELKLNSGNAISLQTKATDLEEGLEFNNVLAILVNNSGNVVDKQYIDEASPVEEDIIHFNSLLPGNYKVYAYANIDATAWQKTGSMTIESQEKNLTAGTPFSSFVDRELASLTGTNVPSDPSTSMLLTGHKEILVGLTKVSDTLDLLRPVVRFKVTVRNHTQFPITVNDLHFSNFNPDKAYLLDHHNASGVPSVPAGVTYRGMPTFDTSAGDNNSVAREAEEVIYQRLMYENAYPGHYKIYATLSLDRTSVSMSTLQLSLGDHPFGIIDYETLSQMDEGEKVDVLVFNPQISVRSGRLLCYISSENNMVWESAGYENYNGFLNRAYAIYTESNSYDYSSRYPEYSNTNGYSGWDGLNASSGSKANIFYYSGAKSRYFHTLTKSNGGFSLSGLALQQGNSNDNGKCVTPITGLQITKGASYYKNNEWKNPQDMTDDLIRFKLNTNDYIQCDALWSATPNIKTNLKVFSGNEANGDRQFALFGKYNAGGPLKRILKENNKEVPLTYMARNEEINVIINVYYSDKQGELNFVVDNSTWGTATESTHTFN